MPVAEEGGDRARAVCYSRERICFYFINERGRAAVAQQGGKSRTGGNISARTRAKTWGKGSGWDDSFKRTRYGYPSASARLGMQAQASRRARNRVVGSKLTHNATLGYISRGSARRHGLDNPGWTRYLPFALVAVALVAALAGIGYLGHGESLGKMMSAFKAPSLSARAAQVKKGAEAQVGVASSRAVVAAANAYAEAQDNGQDSGDGTSNADGAYADGTADGTATSDGSAATQESAA